MEPHVCAGWNACFLLVFAVLSADVTGNIVRKPGKGCADGNVRGVFTNPSIVACAGSWEEHIRNGDSLCSSGWKVCSAVDKDRLKSISWLDAISLEGCFAINAAQDNGLCVDCTNDLEQDDLAGIGRGCPHQNYGQSSCITGGRIDVSCCVDTRFNQSCSYKPGLTTGVLCCREEGYAPTFLTSLPVRFRAVRGSDVRLRCDVSSDPEPTVLWYKNHYPLLDGNRRVTILRNSLIISDLRKSDAGHYRCVAWNLQGHVAANTQLVVKEPPSGCADGSSEGLQFLQNVSACSGSWRGHVKRARHLCSPGWRVCMAQDTKLLRHIKWQHATSIGGCYAYNAANIHGKCSRCHTKNMAGVGRHCGLYERQGESCFRKGRIDVYGLGSVDQGCNYSKGLTTGVLCCKQHDVPRNRHGHHRRGYRLIKYLCKAGCLNGGHCIGRNKCLCSSGYRGMFCQFAVCTPSCGENQVCVSPGRCRCAPGYFGHSCNKARCGRACLNKGRCRDGRCYCSPLYWGQYCQYKSSTDDKLGINNTE